jgi:hypothetical protein
LKDKSTWPHSVGNSLWKSLCTCRNTDLTGKKLTCLMLSILVRYSICRVSQEPNVENNCSEGRIEIVRGGTVTATKTDVVVFWIITQRFSPIVGHRQFGGTYFFYLQSWNFLFLRVLHKSVHYFALLQSFVCRSDKNLFWKVCECQQNKPQSECSTNTTLWLHRCLHSFHTIHYMCCRK